MVGWCVVKCRCDLKFTPILPEVLAAAKLPAPLANIFYCTRLVNDHFAKRTAVSATDVLFIKVITRCLWLLIHELSALSPNKDMNDATESTYFMNLLNWSDFEQYMIFECGFRNFRPSMFSEVPLHPIVCIF
jgi:hypothetical protein